MPLSDEIIAARIEVRICELRVLAALAAKQCHARGLPGVASPGVTGAPWRPSPSAWRFQPVGQAGGDGRS
jgi:hypothetical protein